MIRTFIAIDLPASTREVLLEVVQRLRRKIPEGQVRWSRPEGIHLTLQFLGDVAEADLPQIKDVLAQIAQRHAPFTFSVRGLGCFPNAIRPRVLWIGVREEMGALAALQRDVEKGMVPLGFEPERRTFHPHLTLGRTHRNIRPADQRQLGETISGTEVGELDRVDVASFELIRSDLHPSGAVYTPLAVLKLRVNPQG